MSLCHLTWGAGIRLYSARRTGCLATRRLSIICTKALSQSLSIISKVNLLFDIARFLLQTFRHPPAKNMKAVIRCIIAILSIVLYLGISYLLWNLADVSPVRIYHNLPSALCLSNTWPWLLISVLTVLYFSLCLWQRSTFAGYSDDALNAIINECSHITHKDYSEGLKQLITLTSACMTISITLLNDQKSEFIVLAWLYWGLCILCCLCSIFLSIVVSYTLPAKLANTAISPAEIKRPSNIPELTCAAYSFLSFVLGLLFFMLHQL